MKILVIGGMHGNELLGQQLVRLLQQKRIKDVDYVLANQKAIDAEVRFLEKDLNRAFPGCEGSSEYEAKRAAELLELSKNYDIVLDFHNTYCPDNDCGFVGELANELTFKVAIKLGITRMIVADYDCINKYANNCLSVEVSVGGELDDPEIWYDKIYLLEKDNFSNVPRLNIKLYKFVYRMTLDDKETYELDTAGLQAFVKIDTRLATQIGVRSPAFPIFVNDKFTPYNYGGIVNEL